MTTTTTRIGVAALRLNDFTTTTTTRTSILLRRGHHRNYRVSFDRSDRRDGSVAPTSTSSLPRWSSPRGVQHDGAFATIATTTTSTDPDDDEHHEHNDDEDNDDDLEHACLDLTHESERYLDTGRYPVGGLSTPERKWSDPSVTTTAVDETTSLIARWRDFVAGPLRSRSRRIVSDLRRRGPSSSSSSRRGGGRRERRDRLLAHLRLRVAASDACRALLDRLVAEARAGRPRGIVVFRDAAPFRDAARVFAASERPDGGERALAALRAWNGVFGGDLERAPTAEDGFRAALRALRRSRAVPESPVVGVATATEASRLLELMDATHRDGSFHVRVEPEDALLALETWQRTFVTTDGRDTDHPTVPPTDRDQAERVLTIARELFDRAATKDATRWRACASMAWTHLHCARAARRDEERRRRLSRDEHHDADDNEALEQRPDDDDDDDNDDASLTTDTFTVESALQNAETLFFRTFQLPMPEEDDDKDNDDDNNVEERSTKYERHRSILFRCLLSTWSAHYSDRDEHHQADVKLTNLLRRYLEESPSGQTRATHRSVLLHARTRSVWNTLAAFFERAPPSSTRNAPRDLSVVHRRAKDEIRHAQKVLDHHLAERDVESHREREKSDMDNPYAERKSVGDMYCTCVRLWSRLAQIAPLSATDDDDDDDDASRAEDLLRRLTKDVDDGVAVVETKLLASLYGEVLFALSNIGWKTLPTGRKGKRFTPGQRRRLDRAAHRAENLLNDLLRWRTDTDADVRLFPGLYASVISAYARTGNVAKALEQLRRAEDLRRDDPSSNARVDVRDYTRVLDGCADSLTVDEIDDLVDRAERLSSNTADAWVYRAAINAYARTGAPDAGDRAERLLDRVVARGGRPDVRLFDAAIDAHARAGGGGVASCAAALRLRARMREDHGVEPDARLAAALARAFANGVVATRATDPAAADELADMALRALEDAERDHDGDPGEHVYAETLRAVASTRAPNRALRARPVVDRMPDDGTPGAARALVTARKYALHACADAADDDRRAAWETARECAAALRELGRRRGAPRAPDDVDYAALFEAYHALGPHEDEKEAKRYAREQMTWCLRDKMLSRQVREAFDDEDTLRELASESSYPSVRRPGALDEGRIPREWRRNIGVNQKRR